VECFETDLAKMLIEKYNPELKAQLQACMDTYIHKAIMMEKRFADSGN
jgi:hypothetical protein